MQPKACQNHGYSQFELCKLIYTSGILNKIKLTPTSKLVLIALANHYNPDKADMFPSQEYLCRQLGISKRSVINAVNELKTKALIMYETKKVNRYVFTASFFKLINFAPEGRKNCTNKDEKIAPEQINEKITNIQFFQKKSFGNHKTTKQKYHHDNHLTGINYKQFRPEKLKKESPLDFTRDEAINFINNLPQNLKNSFFAQELRKKWNI